MAKETLLVTGGCRSGKSARALWEAEQMGGEKRLFVATCVPADEEMEDRVARHRRERGENWQTVECPVEIGRVIRETPSPSAVVLVDCLTLWVNNLLAVTDRQADIEAHIGDLEKAVREAAGSVILVSNEVGCGIVPENRTARLFRDMVGLANQRLAGAADRVIWMVSGIPVTVKGAEKK